jgi:uncharacterized protein YktB (UPF0637 family)
MDWIDLVQDRDQWKALIVNWVVLYSSYIFMTFTLLYINKLVATQMNHLNSSDEKIPEYILYSIWQKDTETDEDAYKMKWVHVTERGSIAYTMK